MYEKKEKLRAETLKAAQENQDIETFIFNKQDVFLKIEEAYRQLCGEYKIADKVNINHIEEENEGVDPAIVINRKELD